jgi:hypothetical protein
MKDSLNLENVIENFNENCYVKLNIDFCKELFRSISKNYPPRNKILANFLEVRFFDRWNMSPNINRWYYSGVVPLTIIKRIVKKSKFTWNDVERNLLGIKLQGGKKEIFIKPRFPLKIDAKLGRIVGNILGDGSVSQDFEVFYTNQDKILAKEFYQSVKEKFGLEGRIWIQKPGNFKKKSKWIKRIYSIEDILNGYQIGIFYPKIVGLILNSIFNNFAKGFHKTISKNILEAPQEFILGLLGGFYDDEGNVSISSGGIRVFQKNRKILESIQKLLNQFEIKSMSIKFYIKNNKKHYYFDIFRLENLKTFKNKINFLSIDKSMKLDMLIRNTSIGKKLKLESGLIENKIFEIMKNIKSQLSTNDIKEILEENYLNVIWRERSINKVLNNLNKRGDITKICKKGRIIWSLTEN